MKRERARDGVDFLADPSLAPAAEFPRASRPEWLGLASAVLRKSGAPVGTCATTALRWRTYDDLDLMPLYTSDDALPAVPNPGVAPFVRGARRRDGDWEIRQRHANPDVATTMSAVSADLAGGTRSLWLRLGTDAICVTDLETVLRDVSLQNVSIALDAGVATVDVSARFVALAASRRIPVLSLRGTLGADPIGCQARFGVPADMSLLDELAGYVRSYPHMRIATVDATVYHESGGSDADELAVATSVGVAYLRALTSAGLTIDDALEALEFRFAVTADQFGSIAKLRAARRMWDRVAELSGASAERNGQRQHATTSTPMLTRRDPWVNLLRATVACFAAVVGGAEAITVWPFDAALGLPDGQSRSLARNTHVILQDEASLCRVLDAAGGSWYVESRTDALASRAWDVFTGIEQRGGALAALNSGFLDKQLSAAREARRDDIAHRRAPITGVSEFAHLGEVPICRSPGPATTPHGTAQRDGVGVLRQDRHAEPFEALRDRADAHYAATGSRPRVALAALGSAAAHGAQLVFATNLFAAGGVEAVPVAGDADDLLAALSAHHATVACLCPPDLSYAAAALQAATALRARGAGLIWLTGNPAIWAGTEVAGVTEHLYSGVNAVAVLHRTLDALGVAR